MREVSLYGSMVSHRSAEITHWVNPFVCIFLQTPVLCKSWMATGILSFRWKRRMPGERFSSEVLQSIRQKGFPSSERTKSASRFYLSRMGKRNWGQSYTIHFTGRGFSKDKFGGQALVIGLNPEDKHSTFPMAGLKGF
jgi:hypothetical protein